MSNYFGLENATTQLASVGRCLVPAPRLLKGTFRENEATTAKRFPAAAGVLAGVTGAEYSFNRDLGPQTKATTQGDNPRRAVGVSPLMALR